LTASFATGEGTDLVTEEGPAAPRTREAAPAPLWILAGTALAPFPFAAGVYGYGPPAMAREAVTVLLTWSAVVLSFLAGVRWGLESGRRAPRVGRLALAMAFAIIAWALLLARWRLPLAWTLTFYLAAFIVQWLSDHAAPNTAARFPRLSTAVTAAACVSLAVALDQAIRS
jgi:hypothetical protein